MQDHSGFTQKFLPYTRALKRLVGRMVKTDDIEDIVQETFVRSYEANLKSEIKYVRSYMLQTAKHIALNHLAKWDNKYNDSLDSLALPPAELNTPQFESQFASKERFLLFCKATEQLEGNVRKAFILKKVYGLPQKEIADILQLSESTVEKHVARGLCLSAQFMENLEQHPQAEQVVANIRQRVNER